MPVAGLRGTGDWSDGERPKNFRDSILWMSPNGDTPLLALTSRIGGKKMVTDDPEFNWWAEPVDLVRLQVNGLLGTGDTLVTIDSGDPTSANIKQHWGKATHLVPGDILMVEPAADTTTDTAERLVVTNVHSETAFSVGRGASGTTPAAIPNDAHLLLVGNMFAEGTAEPRATSRNPVKFFNYTQIFKTTYDITGTAAETKLRTGDPVANDKKRKSFDHARAMEMALLWGKRWEGIGDNGKPIRTMGGIRSFIPAANTHILAADWGLAMSDAAGNNLLDMIGPVFDYSSPAGDTRIAFCGNGALTALNRAILKSAGGGGVQIQWGMDKSYWGMNFTELRFPQGSIMLKTHPLLSRHPVYTYSMWLLDFSVIKYVPMKNRDTKTKDNIQNPGEDVRRGMWQTEASIFVDYAGQTLGYIGGFNNASAA